MFEFLFEFQNIIGMDTDWIKNTKVLPIETSGLLLEFRYLDTDLIKNAKASKALPIEASGLLLESILGYRFDKECKGIESITDRD